MNTTITIGIIGGGAAGLMAAEAAAQAPHARITLLEKNKVCGKKILITGKGRCNLTNDCLPQEFLQNVVQGQKFLYSSLAFYSPADTMASFTQWGVPLKTERGRRVFPQSDRALDIKNALCQAVASHPNVKICHQSVLSLSPAHRGWQVQTDQETHFFHRLILATGGISYPRTGSTGDGYRWAKELGHTVCPLKPSLVRLVCRENWCQQLEGLALRNVKLSLWKNGKCNWSQQGELLFTHDGVSGPLVLTASAHLRDLCPQEPCTMTLDLKPALSVQELDRRVLGDLELYRNKDLINAWKDLLPLRFIPVFVAQSGLDPRQKANAVTREQRTRLVNLLKAFPLTAQALGPVEEAVVTAGGVSLKEVNPKTMQSKLHPGLYFAGEVLDLDAYTGGYNLQIAFSTGRLAGHSASQTEQ